MNRMTRRLTWLIVVGSLGISGGAAHAVNLISGGDFEYFAAVPDWDLEESIYDQTTMMDRDFGEINTAQQQNFGPHSGTLALWLRPFVGGNTVNPDNLVNAVLSQTVPAVEDEDYTFSGWSRFEANYSGGFETLPTGPLSGMTSPTTTTMRLEFLNSGGSVIGAATPVDVEAERIDQSFLEIANDNVWYQHSLMATAPMGTQSVRVTAEARQMVATQGPDGGFYDDFALTAASDPLTELLANPLLETRPDLFDPHWEDTQVAGGMFPADPTISVADFASRPDGQGHLGVWLRAFTGNGGQPADAILEQTVPASPGGEYEFSGWSSFQQNYSGGSQLGRNLFEMEFLDASEEVIDDTLTLDLVADGQSNGAGWMEHALEGTAPEGTVSVRVRAAALDMVFTMDPGQSAFWDDFMLELLSAPGLAGDHNGDGTVDAADYALWRSDPSAYGNAQGYTDWVDNFGATSGSGGANLRSAGAIPEPGCCLLAVMGLLAGAGLRRRM